MTTLVRRNANSNWLPSLFNDFFDNEWLEPRMNGGITPAINVKETKEAYAVEVAAPGMTKEDFSLHIDDNDNLVIVMEKKAEEKQDNKEERYLRREFSYSKFQQAMLLPDDVDQTHINAAMDKGVLTVTLPKRPEVKPQPSARQIEIR